MRETKYQVGLRLSSRLRENAQAVARFRNLSLNQLCEELLERAARDLLGDAYMPKSDERQVPSANIEEKRSDPSPETT